jgi:hypothetical protein
MVLRVAVKLVTVGRTDDGRTVTVTVALAMAAPSVMVYENVSVPTKPPVGV